MSIENDIFILEIKKIIPENWSIKIGNDKIIFERNGEIWIKQEYKLNAPVDQDKESDSLESFQKSGRKETCRLELTIEKRNRIDFYFSKIKENMAIHNLVNKLIAKYNIDKLIDPLLSRKGEPFFIPKTEKDKLRVEQYHREKLKLEKRLNIFPSYYIENHVLFFYDVVGIDDELHSVYPAEAAKELYSLQEALKSNLATLFYDEVQDISKFENRVIFMRGKISEIPYQHLIKIPEGYANISYLDIKNNQIVVYTKEPVKPEKKIELIGKVISVEGLSKKPGSDDKVSEYQLIADYFNYID